MIGSRSALSYAILAFTTLALAPLSACGGHSQNPPGGETSDEVVCAAFKTYVSACPTPGLSAACIQAELDTITSDCSSLAAIYSDAYKTAFTTCAPAAGCPNNSPFGACFVNTIQNAPLTAAQTTLANDYCTSCATSQDETVDACIASFYGLGDAGSGEGSEWVQMSDTFIARIDSSCATSCASFSSCAQSIADQLEPASTAACTSSSGSSTGSADGG